MKSSLAFSPIHLYQPSQAYQHSSLGFQAGLQQPNLSAAYSGPQQFASQTATGGQPFSHSRIFTKPQPHEFHQEHSALHQQPFSRPSESHILDPQQTTNIGGPQQQSFHDKSHLQSSGTPSYSGTLNDQSMQKGQQGFSGTGLKAQSTTLHQGSQQSFSQPLSYSQRSIMSRGQQAHVSVSKPEMGVSSPYLQNHPSNQQGATYGKPTGNPPHMHSQQPQMQQQPQFYQSQSASANAAFATMSGRSEQAPSQMSQPPPQGQQVAPQSFQQRSAMLYQQKSTSSQMISQVQVPSFGEGDRLSTPNPPMPIHYQPGAQNHGQPQGVIEHGAYNASDQFQLQQAPKSTYPTQQAADSGSLQGPVNYVTQIHDSYAGINQPGASNPGPAGQGVGDYQNRLGSAPFVETVNQPEMPESIQYTPIAVEGHGIDARTKEDPQVVAEQMSVSVGGAPGSANGRVALLQQALACSLCQFLVEKVLENPTLKDVADPSAAKVFSIDLLKLLTKDPGYGPKFKLILNDIPAWKKYKSQDHSLYITDQERRADYFLTDGEAAEKKLLTQG